MGRNPAWQEAQGWNRRRQHQRHEAIDDDVLVRERRMEQLTRLGIPWSLAQAAAEQPTAGGPYDAVIHNAGVGYREPRRIRTDDGLAHVFAINVLAPYLLTGLIERPGRWSTSARACIAAGIPA